MASIFDDPAFKNNTGNDLIRESKVKPEPITSKSPRNVKLNGKPTLNSVIKQLIQASDKNTSDRPNIKNIKFGNNASKSKLVNRGSLINDFNNMNQAPESRFSKSTLPTKGKFFNGLSSALYGQYANQGFVPMPLDKYNSALIKLSAGNDNWNTQGTNVPVNNDGTLYLDPNTKLPTEITKYDDNGLPMYFDTRDNTYKYIDVGADEPNPTLIGDVSTNYVDPRNIRAPEVFAPEPSFDKRAYPTLDDIFMRVNNARDLTKIGTGNTVYNPDADNSINNSVPALYSKNQSTIPTNQSNIPSSTSVSTPKITIGSMATSSPTSTVTPKNTPNKTATIASQVSTPVTTRVNPQNASMTQSVPVEEVSLSSIVKPLTRRNGGFNEYRRQSALAALRNAGGMSPAEGVQRGIIPYEALQYI